MTQRRRKRRSRFGRRAFLAGAGCAALAGAGLMLRRGQTVSALSVPAPEAEPNAALPAGEDFVFGIVHIGICFGILVDSEDVSQTVYHGHGSYSLRLLSCINCTKKAPIGFCHNYTVFIIFHFCFVVNTNITECGAKRPFSVLTAACRPAGCCPPRSPHRTGAARYPPPLCRLPVQGCRYRPHIKW